MRAEYVRGGSRVGAGRPAGPKMPCGWGCGKHLKVSDVREHFKTCPKRPKEHNHA